MTNRTMVRLGGVTNSGDSSETGEWKKSPFVLSIVVLALGSICILSIGYETFSSLFSLIKWGVPILLLCIFSATWWKRKQYPASDIDTSRIIVSIFWVFLIATIVNIFPIRGEWALGNLAFFLSILSVPMFLLGPGDFWIKTGLARSEINARVIFVTLIGGIVVLPSLAASLPFILERLNTVLAVEIIALCVLPGVFEELLCRGLVQDTLRRRWNNPYSAIVVTSLIFGLYHMPRYIVSDGDVILALLIALSAHTISGLAFGTMRELSESLIPSIILHTLGNILAISILQDLTYPPQPQIFSITMIVLLLIAGLLHWRKSRADSG